MKKLFIILIVILFLATLIGLYFLPTIIARKRKHKNKNPIIALNLFLGWSFVCWIICLVWSLSDNVKAEDPNKIINVKPIKTRDIPIEEEEFETWYLPNGTISKKRIDRRINQV